MHPPKSRYRFYDPNGTPPFALDNGDKDKDTRQDPDTKHTDSPDKTDDDLKNVDKSKGGYGGGSGFGPDRN